MASGSISKSEAKKVELSGELSSGPNMAITETAFPEDTTESVFSQDATAIGGAFPPESTGGVYSSAPTGPSRSFNIHVDEGSNVAIASRDFAELVSNFDNNVAIVVKGGGNVAIGLQSAVARNPESVEGATKYDTEAELKTGPPVQAGKEPKPFPQTPQEPEVESTNPQITPETLPERQTQSGSVKRDEPGSSSHPPMEAMEIHNPSGKPEDTKLKSTSQTHVKQKHQSRNPPRYHWEPASVLPGFPLGSEIIVRDKDKSSTIFRRFDKASSRNLLYLQSRVATLEAKQKTFDEEDAAAYLNDPADRLKALEERLEFMRKQPGSSTEKENRGWKERVKDLESCLLRQLEPLCFQNLPGEAPKRKKKENLVITVSPEPLPREVLKRLEQLSRHEEIFPPGELANKVSFWCGSVQRNFRNPIPDLDRLWLYGGETSSKIWGQTLEDLEFLLQKSLIADLKRRCVPYFVVFNFSRSWEDMQLFREDVDTKALIEEKEREWEQMRQQEKWRDREQHAISRMENPYSGLASNTEWIEKLKMRYTIAKELGMALKQYHEALLLQKKLLAVPSPAGRTTETLRRWFDGITDEGDGDPPLFIGSSADIFGPDMISLGPVGEEDLISKAFLKFVPSWFIAKKISDEKTQYTSEKKVGRVVSVINMLAAIGLLVVAVWVLSVVNDYKLNKSTKVSTETELGVMTGFIVFFAIWVGFFTSASRKEVFGAVAVYAAVLVVFVGGSGSS